MAPVVIFLMTLAVFLPSLAAGFVDLDDWSLLITNDKWRGLGADQLRWMFTTTMFGHYQPLTWLSYAINFEADGMNPGGYHAVNAIIHAINAVLVYLVGLRLLTAAGERPGARAFTEVQKRMAAGMGAMVWAVHPLRAESVAWVTERRDVLSTVFLLGSLLAYLQMTAKSAPGVPRQKGWAGAYAASIALLAVSLLCKSWGMSLFVILILLDWYPLNRLRMLEWKRSTPALVEKFPFVVLGGIAAVVAGLAQRSAPGAMRTLDQWPLSWRFAQAAYGLVFYMWKSLAPSGLAPLYELPQRVNPFGLGYLVCYAIVAAGVILAVISVRRWPAITVAAAAYAVLLAPVLGFFQSGDQFVADRYSYVAMIGWSLLLGGGLATAIRWAPESNKFKPGILRLGGAAALLALGILSLNQTMVWNNSLSLWEHAVHAGVTTPDVRVNYGLNLEREARDPESRPPHTDAERQQMLEAAAEEYRLAAQDRPGNGRAWYCLANISKTLKRYEEADKAFEQAARTLPQAYMALMNRGRLLIDQLNRHDEGIACLRAAVADIERPRTGPEAGTPLSGKPYLALGSVLWNSGEKDEARTLLRKALSFEDSRDTAIAQLKAIGEVP
jgi:tetratricopeptide (TPR) repeat protein